MCNFQSESLVDPRSQSEVRTVMENWRQTAHGLDPRIPSSGGFITGATVGIYQQGCKKGANKLISFNWFCLLLFDYYPIIYKLCISQFCFFQFQNVECHFVLFNFKLLLTLGKVPIIESELHIAVPYIMYCIYLRFKMFFNYQYKIRHTQYFY